MIMEWSLCKCCGKSAQPRKIPTSIYAGGWLYPALCDCCFNDICLNFHNDADAAFREIERREAEFKKDFDVIGFETIIQPKPSALVYQI